MTNEEREIVVELLRCAADLAINGDRDAALGKAAFELERIFMPFLRQHTGDSHWVSLLDAPGPVKNDAPNGRWICGKGYEWVLLEAAQCVEEGRWP
jgi:hypothetical protein